MTTERERIDKMLAEGKVSAEEAERLRAALERSERVEAQAQPGPGEKIRGPRLSRLALAGALGLPAAGVTFLFVMGLAIVFGVRSYRATEGAFLVAAAVALTGIGLSVAGLVAIRRAPGELTGLRAARFGIIAPLVTGAVALVVTVAVTIVAYHYNERARLAKARAAKEEDLRRDEETERREEAWRRDDDEEVLYHLWDQFHSIVMERRTGGMPAERLQQMLGKLLEPDWAGAIAEGAWRDGGSGTLLGDKMERLVTARGGKAIRWSRCTLEHSGEGFHRENVSGTIVVTDWRKDHHVPVVKIGNRWYFARKRVKEMPVGMGEEED